MKPFEYYRENPFPYPTRQEEKDFITARKKVIDDTPMTADQREKALNDLQEEVKKWRKEKVKPYNEFAAQREAEFWQDCRNHFGYEKYLDPKGVAALEYKAYEDGHANGFWAIFDKLQELHEFLKGMLTHIKPL